MGYAAGGRRRRRPCACGGRRDIEEERAVVSGYAWMRGGFHDTRVSVFAHAFLAALKLGSRTCLPAGETRLRGQLRCVTNCMLGRCGRSSGVCTPEKKKKDARSREGRKKFGASQDVGLARTSARKWYLVGRGVEWANGKK